MIISFKGNGGGGGGYVLPTATANRLGGIKVGSGLTVQNDGTLSSDGISSADTQQLIQTAMAAETARTEQTYLKSVPVATTATTGVVKIGAGLDVDSAGTISVSGGTGGGPAVYNLSRMSQAELSGLCAELMTYFDRNSRHCIGSAYTASDYEFYYTTVNNDIDRANFQVLMFLSDIDDNAGGHVSFAGTFGDTSVGITLYSDGTLNNEDQTRVLPTVARTYSVTTAGTYNGAEQ